MTARAHPFDLLFAPFRASELPAIRAALGGRRGVADFVLCEPALLLLRALRPDEGLGDAVDDFVVLVHAAFWFWHDGERTVSIDAAELARTITAPAPQPHHLLTTQYIQLPPRIVWGQLSADIPFEPLDGWFATVEGDALRAVACFGVHPERPGISVSAVIGPEPEIVRRADGQPLFTPTMPGGDLAGLHAIDSPAELLWLAWCTADPEELS
jgi:hypothetical protein